MHCMNCHSAKPLLLNWCSELDNNSVWLNHGAAAPLAESQEAYLPVCLIWARCWSYCQVYTSLCLSLSLSQWPQLVHWQYALSV